VCTVEGVLPTTNHLESFNGLLKNKHLRRWQRGGRRLRFDVLIHTLITRILPSVFEQRALLAAERRRCDELVRTIPGGAEIVARLRQAGGRPISALVFYLHPDPRRDEQAAQLLANKQIGTPAVTSTGLDFECYSSIAFDVEIDPARYVVHLSYVGHSHCSCLDFVRRGGACKHLRAALLRCNTLRAAGTLVPAVHVPESESAALSILPLAVESHPAAALPLGVDPVTEAAQAIDALISRADTLFEDDAPADQELGEEDEDDRESTRTDVSDDDDDDALGLGCNQRSHVVANGINAQAVKRALFDLDHIARLLENVTADLAGASLDDDDVPRALLARDRHAALVSQLNLLVDPAPSAPPPSFPPYLPSQLMSFSSQLPSFPSTQPPCSQVPPRKRKTDVAPSILPPSPEKKQKRKDSHGIH
jgi:hypothetical protein